MDPCDQAELEREIAEPRHLLPEHLRRGVMIVVVSDEGRQAMVDEWVCIGHETSEQLAVRLRACYVNAIK
jgi:hypothetical protein